jgi:hypothetical protein
MALSVDYITKISEMVDKRYEMNYKYNNYNKWEPFPKYDYDYDEENKYNTYSKLDEWGELVGEENYKQYESNIKDANWQKMITPSAVKITQEKEVLEDPKKPEEPEAPKRRKFDLSF